MMELDIDSWLLNVKPGIYESKSGLLYIFLFNSGLSIICWRRMGTTATGMLAAVGQQPQDSEVDC